MSTCTGPECDRPVHGNGLCQGHRKQERQGRELTPLRTWGTVGCDFPGCREPHLANKLCAGHNAQRSKGRELTPLGPSAVDLDWSGSNSPLFGRTGSSHPGWRGDASGYDAVHSRLRKNRGGASQFTCADCDRPAEEWSYEGGCPNERLGDNGNGTLCPFSTDLDRYRPRCRSCHSKKDNRVRNTRSTT